MRLLWVRHGQMDVRASVARDPGAIDRLFNQEDQGSLTARGQREAAQVADRLRGEGVEAIYSSPLLRAKETADVTAARLGLPVRVTETIAELRTGRLKEGTAGARWVAAGARAPLPARLKKVVLGGTLIPLYLHAWRTGRTEGGERPDELRGRVDALLRGLERDHSPGATVALFAHGYLLVTLTWGLGPRARASLLRRPYIPNGAICEMHLERGRLRSVKHADAAHLSRRRARG